MLMTSNVESANDMRVVSGSLCENKGRKVKQMLLFRSHKLIILATHNEAIKRKKKSQYTPNQTCLISTEQGKRESPQS